MPVWLPGKKSQRKSDEDLVREFSSTGDLDILGDLFSRYIHLVYGVCLKYLKNREESKDAVMQIFEKLISEIPRHTINTFRSWLHVVTKNYCLMQIRSQKSDNEKLIEWLNAPGNFMESLHEPHPIDEDGSDNNEALDDCIERLKDAQKECIKLFYFNNKSYSEISVKLGIDEKKVKSYLQNAKRNLKICLEEKNEENREQ